MYWIVNWFSIKIGPERVHKKCQPKVIYYWGSKPLFLVAASYAYHGVYISLLHDMLNMLGQNCSKHNAMKHRMYQVPVPMNTNLKKQ